MTDFVNPNDVEGHLVALTDGGADYSFECVGPCDPQWRQGKGSR